MRKASACAPAATPPPAGTVGGSGGAAPLIASAETERLPRDKDELKLPMEEAGIRKDLIRTPGSPMAPDTKGTYGALFADESKGKKELSMLTAAQWQASLGAMSKTEAAPSVVQSFSQVMPAGEARGGATSQALPQVLISFRVEQAGRELRVVDSDGSVYAGYMQAASAAARRRLSHAEKPALAKAATAPAREVDSGVMADAAQPMNDAYFFRVSGTNRSLKQPVIFIGNMLSLTNAVKTDRARGSFSDGAAGFQGTPAQPAPTLLLNSRISGKVVIGDGKETSIEALPVRP